MKKIDINKELFYSLKDALMPLFLQADIDSIKQNLANYPSICDPKKDKKLIKAAKMLLEYYGVYEN